MLDKIVEKTKQRLEENKKKTSLDRLKYKVLKLDDDYKFPFKKSLN